MQTDFKQERRWKQAVAFEISTNVLEYWAASPDERKQMRVKVRLPLEREAAADTDMGAGEDEHEDADGDAEADAETDEEANEATQVKSELLDEEPAHAKKLQDPVPEPSKSQSKLLEYRAPVFEQPDSRTLVSLDTFSSEDPSFVDFKDMPEPQTMSELMPDLSMYGPPAPPASEEERLQSRRIDPSSPHYSRLTTVSNLMTDKPILLSTLNPAQKRKWGTDQWEDLSDLYLSDEPAEPRPSETNTAVSRTLSQPPRTNSLETNSDGAPLCRSVLHPRWISHKAPSSLVAKRARGASKSGAALALERLVRSGRQRAQSARRQIYAQLGSHCRHLQRQHLPRQGRSEGRLGHVASLPRQVWTSSST